MVPSQQLGSAVRNWLSTQPFFAAERLGKDNQLKCSKRRDTFHGLQRIAGLVSSSQCWIKIFMDSLHLFTRLEMARMEARIWSCMNSPFIWLYWMRLGKLHLNSTWPLQWFPATDNRRTREAHRNLGQKSQTMRPKQARPHLHESWVNVSYLRKNFRYSLAATK